MMAQGCQGGGCIILSLGACLSKFRHHDRISVMMTAFAVTRVDTKAPMRKDFDILTHVIITLSVNM
jgi:hypothetical protein